jgi:hypothetical protein
VVTNKHHKINYTPSQQRANDILVTAITPKVCDEHKSDVEQSPVMVLTFSFFGIFFLFSVIIMK